MSRAGKPVETTSLRTPFVTLSLLLFGATVWAVWDEGWHRRPWKATQARFNEVLAARAQAPIEEGLRQVTIPALEVADRCQSCHLGVDRGGLTGDEVPRELRSHPRREVLLGKHPVERVGCTPCHAGQGLQTKGVAGEPFAHGRDDPYWEQPLRSHPFIQSSCVTCHADDHEISGAPLFNRGRALFEDRRCRACHSTRWTPAPAPPGPPLDRLKEKTSEAFVVAWLREPPKLRRGTRMPSFWPSGSQSAEPVAIAAFLGSVSDGGTASDDRPGDEALVAEGRRLFDSLGCRGCHLLGDADPIPAEARFGPALDGIGARASRAWLERWLADPKALFPETRMPDLRLAEAERSALAAFLSTQVRPGEDVLKPRWSTPSAELIADGKKAVLRYGCQACHRIPGVVAGGRPGPDLDDFGDLPAERLEFAAERPACTFNERECWTMARLQHPEALRRPGLDLVMPRFELSDDEALSLAVFLLSNRKQPSLPRPVREAQRAVAEGERVMARHNCRGCHEVGREERKEGDELRSTPRGGGIARWYDEPALAPPPLTFAGRKFQARWLFDFLNRPRAIRPWLSVRMPTFTFERGEVEALARSFAARDGEPFPFEDTTRPPLDDEARLDGRRLFEKLQCARCHSIGPNVKAGERAPDLTLAASRLKPGWMKAWLLDPQALQPGTRMPAYFFLSDEDDATSWSTPAPALLGGSVERQLDALVGLTLELGHAPPTVTPAGVHP